MDEFFRLTGQTVLKFDCKWTPVPKKYLYDKREFGIQPKFIPKTKKMMIPSPEAYSSSYFFKMKTLGIDPDP